MRHVATVGPCQFLPSTFLIGWRPHRLDRTKRAVLRFLFSQKHCTEERLAELFQCSAATVRRHITNKGGDDLSEDSDLVIKWRTASEAAATTYTPQAATTGGEKTAEDKPKEATSAVAAPSGAITPAADSQRLRICKYTLILGPIFANTDRHHSTPTVLPPAASAIQTAQEQQSVVKATSAEPMSQDRVAKRPHETTSMNGTSDNQSAATNGLVLNRTLASLHLLSCCYSHSDTSKQPETKRARAEASSSRQAESPERTLASTVGRGSSQVAATNGVNGTNAQLPSISAPVPPRKNSLVIRQSEPRPSTSALPTSSEVDMESESSACMKRGHLY